MLKLKAASPPLKEDKVLLMLVLTEMLRVAVRTLESFSVISALCSMLRVSGTFGLSECGLPTFGGDKKSEGSVIGFVMASLFEGSWELVDGDCGRLVKERLVSGPSGSLVVTSCRTGELKDTSMLLGVMGCVTGGVEGISGSLVVICCLTAGVKGFSGPVVVMCSMIVGEKGVS